MSKFGGGLILAAILGLATGCGNTPVSDSGKKPASGTEEHHAEDGHDHDHGDGEHSKHDHPEEGPHHGHLIELGKGDFHGELTHDEASKTITVYLLDGAAKVAVSIADPAITLNLIVDGKPKQVKLTAAPQEGDASGQASRFSVVDESVLEALESPKTTGRLNVTIQGKSYVGTIEHHAHGEHTHE